MPRITRIVDQKSNSDRVSIFIDNAFCTGIRKRTFKAMNLSVGDEITCDQIKEKENFFWKNAYQNVWENEKIRIDRIKQIIESLDERIQLDIVGFGADSNEIIEEHPEEKGLPDLNIVLRKDPKIVLMKIEVTGTESLRGTGYWIRPDKIQYAINHPDEIVWTAVHYSKPNELVRFIKHIPGKEYKVEDIEIRGAGEKFCIFNDEDEEVIELSQFELELINIMDKYGNG